MTLPGVVFTEELDKLLLDACEDPYTNPLGRGVGIATESKYSAERRCGCVHEKVSGLVHKQEGQLPACPSCVPSCVPDQRRSQGVCGPRQRIR